MSRRVFTLAVALFVAACGGSTKVVERSAPERPAWVEGAPTAREYLYFSGTCTDLPNYQEALRCARAEAMTDVATWVGARFSSYVYSTATESTRSSGTTVYFDTEMFLADVRREDTYHEVTQESWGRSYLVAVLVSYPRRSAEAERNRIEQTTRQAGRLVDRAPSRVFSIASRGRWGEAMDSLMNVAARVAVPGNLQLSQHGEQLSRVAADLVSSLRVSVDTSGAEVVAEVRFQDEPAAGVPLECVAGKSKTAVVTGADGRAVCEAEGAPAIEGASVTVRPDISGYLDDVPTRASGIAGKLSPLLDQSVTVGTADTIKVAVWLTGGIGCAPTMEELAERLEAGGVEVTEADGNSAWLKVQCVIEIDREAGELYSVEARGRLTIEIEGGITGENNIKVTGLGVTPQAAREESMRRLGEELSVDALNLLRVAFGTDGS